MSYRAVTETNWNGREVKIRGRKVTGKTMFEIGLVVEGQAKLLTPIRTGLLAGSITTQAFDHGTRPVYPASPLTTIAKPISDMEVLVGTAVEYGPWVEFGTRFSDARPFLRPALDLARGRTLTIARKHGRLEFKDYLT